ncbi:unnamed protein product [Acanthoscelides obtectus]|uniref:G2/mitotic-specific cyclin-B3 n=1 Tax=Acanthoscelides obtectus TaxID=200917 RepID=A0A9P0PEB2_ACAOB|nr:unnamed protein product [Acanthoscelides obtectus]CAK1634344.1 G2/mitotic-specific cyclin-B3 [Acanthoscelides obtectus]
MPPTKTKIMPTGITVRNIIPTRTKTGIPLPNELKNTISSKRKADASPSKENKQNKRIAFGERNINVADNQINKGSKQVDEKEKDVKKAVVMTNAKKLTVQVKKLPSVKTVVKPRQNENLPPPAAPVQKIVTRGAQRREVVPDQTALKAPKETAKDSSNVNKGKRLSNEFEKTEETLYCTALEEINESVASTYFSAKKSQHNLRSANKMVEPPSNSARRPSGVSLVAKQIEAKLNLSDSEVPEGVDNFDKENWNDVLQVSHYAMDIFNYLKERETLFQICDYMDRQICLTKWMRSLLVDWMVEIQESFELNHETLYVGVKLVDMYLSKMTVSRETLQLVGAAAMFVASKYDERIPPQIKDFLYICDGAYSRRDLIRMELNLLKVCDFNLGIPISYRFLRRYARCAKIAMPTLTLARYILEFCLMEYETVLIRDSKLACAAMYLALKMKKFPGWNATLEHYSGYKLEDFKSVAVLLNKYLHQPPKSQLMTVRNKYSHKIFFEVAKTPLIPLEEV